MPTKKEIASLRELLRKAILIIDEHCDLKNRQVFDQDNKGWKAIPNALKGLVVEDDDQQSLELALLSTPDSDEELNAVYEAFMEELFPEEEEGAE